MEPDDCGNAERTWQEARDSARDAIQGRNYDEGIDVLVATAKYLSKSEPQCFRRIVLDLLQSHSPTDRWDALTLITRLSLPGFDDALRGELAVLRLSREPADQSDARKIERLLGQGQ